MPPEGMLFPECMGLRRECVLIQAALNGGTTRAGHPAVPLSPAELAAEARAARLAGAGAFHLHPRDPAGEQTLEPAHVLAAVAAVREPRPGCRSG